jgi:hypothetical protein
MRHGASDDGHADGGNAPRARPIAGGSGTCPAPLCSSRLSPINIPLRRARRIVPIESARRSDIVGTRIEGCVTLALVGLGAFVAVAVTVAGCASTTMQSTWRDPGYSGAPFRKVFVLGQIARDVTARRLLEDALVTRMQAGGADAVPAWRHLPGDRQADEATFAASIAASGADALLMVRLLGIDTQTNISPGWVPGPGYGWYGAYSGWYAVPQVTQYQIAVVETTLFDAQTKRLVWSGTSETFNPTSVQKDAPGFAEVIVSTLQKSGLVPAAK